MAAQTFYVNFIDESLDARGWKDYVSSPVEQQASSGVVVRTLRELLDNENTMMALTDAGVDAVVGGPPCQGFSLAGRRNPEDIRNKLPWEYLSFVERIQPKVVVIENVVGMNHRFSRDEDAPFVQLQQALRETIPGYEVQGVAVNAIHYGAPQNRPRLMIIGLRQDIARANGIKSTGALWTSNFLGEMGLDPIPDLVPVPRVTRAQSPTVGDAIGDLQAVLPSSRKERTRVFRDQTKSRESWGLPRPARRPRDIPNQAPRKHSEETTSRFRVYQWLKASGVSPRLISTLARDPDTARPGVLGQLSTADYPAYAPDGILLASSPEAMLDLIESLATKKHTQKALSWDEPARTVVTLPDDYVHPSEPRIFTVREMARFQGFPDDFVFVGKETTGSLRRRFEVPQYSQVGNAVSPFLAFAVGEMIRKVLIADEDSQSS